MFSNANWTPHVCIPNYCPQNDPYDVLPGATHDVLYGHGFGGLTLDEMVCSSYAGFTHDDRNRSDYKLDTTSTGMRLTMTQFYP